MITAARSDAPLGAPSYWAWLLTGLQVFALWSAGGGRGWGWLLGAVVQVPWIAYAAVTAQLGFIPGCAVSAAVQAQSFLADRPRAGGLRVRDPRRDPIYAGRRR